jgi:D-sedoheptulose 7-phosphate isomerase
MSVVQDYIAALHECLEELSAQKVEEVAGIILDAWKRGKQVFLMGNGGSATTACHLARDLSIGAAAAGKPRLRAISLADSVALITSLANDKDYDSVFEEQLIGQMEAGDVVIGLSASGDSPNVLRAIKYARRHDATTIGFIGFGGGQLKHLVDRDITLSNRDYRQVEDTHLVLAHLVTYLVKEGIARG